MFNRVFWRWLVRSVMVFWTQINRNFEQLRSRFLEPPSRILRSLYPVLCASWLLHFVQVKLTSLAAVRMMTEVLKLEYSIFEEQQGRGGWSYERK